MTKGYVPDEVRIDYEHEQGLYSKEDLFSFDIYALEKVFEHGIKTVK